MLSPARVTGLVLLAASALAGGAEALALVLGWSSPTLTTLAAVFGAAGVYHLVTNIASTQPNDEVPTWWVVGLVALIVTSGTVGFVLGTWVL